MSKKITSYEELLKKGKECEALINIRKKWEDVDLSKDKVVKIGVGSETKLAKELADEVALTVINFLKDKKIADVVVVQTEFHGYSGDKPTLELILPGMGQVVFGNVDSKEAIKLVEKYMINTEEIAKFLIDNHGDKRK